MKFQDLYEKENKEHSAVSPGVQTLPVDQYMGAYKWSKDVAGHDGKKQHSPDVSGSKVYTDKPIVVGYTDLEDKMTKAVLPKTKQTVGAGSEEPATVQKNSPLSKKSVKEAYQSDEANVFYKYDTADGKLKQRMVQNLDEPRARSAGYKETQEQALKAAGIMRSKFDPKKFVQNQNGKWVTVYPYGQQGVAEGSGGNWYIRINGKILNDTKFKPEIFSSEDEARSHAMKLADKKRIPLSQIKLTKSWMDAPEQGVAEGLNTTPKITFAQQTPGSWTRIDILVNGEVKFQAVKTMGPGHWAIYDQDGEVIGGGGNKTELKASVLDYLSKQGVAEGSEKRCQQCGMKNCSCPGDSCKCKPIAGWIPGKGFKKAVEEAKGLAKKVKVVKGEHAGKIGWIREIKHGAHTSAPKTYYIDLDDGGQANNLPATSLRLVKAVDEGITADIRDYFANPKNDTSSPFRKKAMPPEDIQLIMLNIKQRQPVSKADQYRLADWLRRNQGTRTVYADVNESDMGEGVIYQLDKENPMSGTEVLVIGGAGRYSLDGLRAKARKEVAELAKDLEIEHGGAFRRSAHNVKQLQNTLNTIVAAYDELNQIRKLGGMRSKGIKDEDATVVREGVAVMEKWTQKYKNSINCSDPKGFSQRAHCAGKKK